MEQVTAKKALEDKNVQHFLKHVTEEMNSLDKLLDIDSEDYMEIAVEVKARKLAYKKLENIIDPLISTKDKVVHFNNQEYIV